MITEALMRPGSGRLNFTRDIPARITNTIRDLVDENAGTGAVGAHIVITPVRVDTTLTDAQLLSVASYTGVITARPSRLSVEFSGLSRWLDTSNKNVLSRSAGTPTQWLSDILTNGLTSGSITGGSNVTRQFEAYAQSRRQVLDAWSQLAGLEYRVQPDFTVDVAAATTLFESPPTVVVTRREEGPDGDLRGVEGGFLDQALTRLGPQLCTEAVVLGPGWGTGTGKGSDTQTLNLKTPAGGTPELVSVFSAPSEADNLAAVAEDILALQGARRAIKVSSRTHHLPRFVTPGDEVYVYDLAAGLVDSTNEVTFWGEVIYPATVRLLSYTYPIEEGLGVYLRSNAVTPTITDLTDWVKWETGDTFWTVGDWAPPNYGPVNRTAPNIEERLAPDSPWTVFTPSWTNLSNLSANTGRWRYIDGGRAMHIITRCAFDGTSTVDGSVTLAIPNSETISPDFQYHTYGDATFREGGVRSWKGEVVRNSSTSVVLNVRTASLNYVSLGAISSTVPHTWGNTDAIVCDFVVPIGG